MQGILMGREEYLTFRLHVGMLIPQIRDHYSFWTTFFCFPQKNLDHWANISSRSRTWQLSLSKCYQQGWIWNQTDYYCSREEPSWITERQFTMKVYDVLVASTTLAKEPASVKKSLGMATATKLISCSFRKPCIRCTMERAFSCCSTNIWIHILPGEAWSPKTTNPNANSRNCRRTGWNGFVATCNG